MVVPTPCATLRKCAYLFKLLYLLKNEFGAEKNWKAIWIPHEPY